MSKKKKKKRQDKVGTPAAFAPGSQVRVRYGVKDPDNPDMPIGGWCGTVVEVDADGPASGYLVEWDRRTLDAMHPIFVKRCHRDDLELESMWLDEADLEPDGGEGLAIEQPTALVTRPLNPENQDDRLRALFSLTSDDPLPAVSEETLAGYHAYLAARLRFPFNARGIEETGPLELRQRKIKALRLIPPDECDEEDGLLCAGLLEDAESDWPLWELEADGDGEQRRLVRDYSYWFSNFHDEADVIPFPAGLVPEQALENVPPLALGRIVNAAGMLGIAYGGTVGPIAAVFERARLGMAIGAGVMGVLVGVMGRRYGVLLGAVNRSRHGPLLGIFLGLLAGALLGALGGALAVAWMGTVAGSIVGVVLGGMLAPQGRKAAAKSRGGFTGAAVGAIALAVYTDYQAGLIGLAAGALIGGVAAVLLVMVAIVLFAVALGPPTR